MRRSAATTLLLGLIGCSGGGSPTAPTGTPTAPPLFELTGTVRDAHVASPVSGVTLSAVDGPNAGKTTTTTADGRYTLGSLQHGTFTLRARHTSYDLHLQEVTITINTNIDIRLIPTRALSSGWSGGTFFASVDGEQIGNRVTSASISQSGTTVTGLFSTIEGTSGTFTGHLTGSQFSGTMRAEVVHAGRRCRGMSIDATGTLTGDLVSVGAPALLLETCGGSISSVSLTLTP
jgi:hypothetical protein